VRNVHDSVIARFAERWIEAVEMWLRERSEQAKGLVATLVATLVAEFEKVAAQVTAQVTALARADEALLLSSNSLRDFLPQLGAWLGVLAQAQVQAVGDAPPSPPPSSDLVKRLSSWIKSREDHRKSNTLLAKAFHLCGLWSSPRHSSVEMVLVRWLLRSVNGAALAGHTWLLSALSTPQAMAWLETFRKNALGLLVDTSSWLSDRRELVEPAWNFVVSTLVCFLVRQVLSASLQFLREEDKLAYLQSSLQHVMRWASFREGSEASDERKRVEDLVKRLKESAKDPRAASDEERARADLRRAVVVADSLSRQALGAPEPAVSLSERDGTKQRLVPAPREEPSGSAGRTTDLLAAVVETDRAPSVSP